MASEGNVYRYWLNDTYQWHNDKDNHYYTREPRRGYKFLIIFVNMVNSGNTRVWLPSRDSIRVMYAGRIYNTDPEHPMPDLTSRIKETPIEVGEIQYFHKFYGTEYVEDFGYSHGMPLDYLYPGESNAIDGYLLYEVPASLTPEMTYVEIAFNGKDVGVWTLS